MKCCERDNDGDGNCDIHSAPGVLRKPKQTAPESRAMIFRILESMTDDRRLALFQEIGSVYCLECGREHGFQRCQCSNDE